MSLQQKKRLDLQTQWPSLQRERDIYPINPFHQDCLICCESLTSAVCDQPVSDVYSHILARYNNVRNICIHLNLSILITSSQPANSPETTIISSRTECQIKSQPQQAWPNSRTPSPSSGFSQTALAHIICFPWGQWQLHWLIVNDKRCCLLPNQRVAVRWVSPWQGDEQATLADWNVYQPLPVGLSPDPKPRPSSTQALMKQDETGGMREGVPSVCTALVIT